jgi:hypothetical protein
MHADACAKRKIEIQDQELRAFVVKHSVVRIHLLFGFAAVLLVSLLLGPVHRATSDDSFATFMVFAGLVIVASTRNIAGAVASRRE